MRTESTSIRFNYTDVACVRVCVCASIAFVCIYIQHSAAAELNEIINGEGYFQDTDTFANIWYLRVRGEN